MKLSESKDNPQLAIDLKTWIPEEDDRYPILRIEQIPNLQLC